MPEFRDINLSGLEVQSYPINKWRRPFKNTIPYFLGNTANIEISVRRDTANAPELWRIRLFENTIERTKQQMKEWSIQEGQNIGDSHTVKIERYLDTQTKRIGIQYNGIYEPLVTIDVLSKEQIRLSIFFGIIFAILACILSKIAGFIEIVSFIRITK